MILETNVHNILWVSQRVMVSFSGDMQDISQRNAFGSVGLNIKFSLSACEATMSPIYNCHVCVHMHRANLKPVLVYG